MRLAIEALGVKHGGAATVLTDLLAAAVADPRFDRICVFCSPARARRFSFPVSGKIQEIECTLADGNRLYRLWWVERRLPARLRRLGCDVLICLSGCGRGGPATPHLTLIQQLLPFSTDAMKLAGIAGRPRLRIIRAAMKRSCLSSYKVIVQTHATERAVCRAFSLEPDKMRVVTPSTGEFLRPGLPAAALAGMRASAPGFRVLYVGNQARYKNVMLLVEAVKYLRNRLPHLALFLTWPVNHPLNGRNGVVCLGYLSAAEVAEAYSLSDVFVLPSLEETVGLPLLEAMAAGTPVIAADRPYAREICQAAAAFFDAHDHFSLASRLEAVLTDDGLRAKLILEGHRISDSRRQARPYHQILDLAVEAAASGSNALRTA